MTTDNTQHDETGAEDEVGVRTAATLIERDDVILLDVREDDEWNAGHAPDARHEPLGTVDSSAPSAGAWQADIPDGTTILTVCRSGRRSARAAQILRSAGWTVRNVNGGMEAWAQAGLPVEDSRGQAGTIA